MVLSRFNYRPRFAFLLTAEDVSQGKPHPEVYRLAAQQHDVPAENILVLEDSENGCRAAVAAGAYTVAVPNRHTRHHNFDGVGFIADSLADRRIYERLGL